VPLRLKIFNNNKKKELKYLSNPRNWKHPIQTFPLGKTVMIARIGFGIGFVRRIFSIKDIIRGNIQ
jgi:hypothetical protein